MVISVSFGALICTEIKDGLHTRANGQIERSSYEKHTFTKVTSGNCASHIIHLGG
jgi:hypothetical protein